MLGTLWLVLSPLLMLTVYSVVFGVIFNGRYRVIENETAIDYALGIFLSLTIFRLLSECINVAPTIIISQPNFVKKVVFPLEILPASSVAASLYNFTISIVLVVIAMLMTSHEFTLTNLWFPVILFPLVLFCLGLSWLLAAIGVFFRDISKLMESITLILMYSSAIFFSTQLIQNKGPIFWHVLKFNPLIHCVEESRKVLLWNIEPNIHYVLYTYCTGIFVCLLGLYLFRKMKSAFADVL